MTLVIGPAHEQELAAVGELTLEAYAADGFVTPEADYAQDLLDAATRAHEAELYVARDEGGTLLGTVTYCPEGSSYRELAGAGEGEFRMLAVAPNARGRGVAEALVSLCLERSVELGYSAVVLSSMSLQEQAHRLYTRLGFRRTPELDWKPIPSVELQAFRLDLRPAPGRRAVPGTVPGPRPRG
ncbi:MAG TPA: GNAT family N-acetyltransferase [Nocardioidaceae bacterium]|nr:GNAT family N-acetyltransferase [Nocardioidaceae bacterium]